MKVTGIFLVGILAGAGLSLSGCRILPGPDTSPENIRAQIANMNSADPRVQWGAFGALIQIGAPAVPYLERTFHGGHCGARALSIVLMWILGEAADSSLQADLAGDDPTARGCAAIALAWRRPVVQACIQPLVEVLAGDDAALRQDALYQLEWLEKAAVPSLVTLLEHPEAVVRLRVLGALRRIGPGAIDAVPTINLWRNDPDRFVAAVAAETVDGILEQAAEIGDGLVRTGHDKGKMVEGQWSIQGDVYRLQKVDSKAQRGLGGLYTFGEEATCYDLEAEVHKGSTRQRDFGLAWRCHDGNDFFYLGVLHRAVLLRQGGNWVRGVVSHGFDCTEDRWYKIKIEVRGPHFRIVVDGQETAHGADATLVGGRCGIRAFTPQDGLFRKVRQVIHKR